jgi:hypothetical protein
VQIERLESDWDFDADGIDGDAQAEQPELARKGFPFSACSLD